MSESEYTPETDAAELADAAERGRGSRPASSTARVLPHVRFGLRAAVLAGVIVTAGGATVGLSGAIGGLSGPTDTTCCGGNNAAAHYSQRL
jgi:hypothetical protein